MMLIRPAGPLSTISFSVIHILDLAAATLSADWLQMQHFLNGYLTQSKVSSLYISIMKICLYASMFFYQCAVPMCVYVCRQQLDEQLTQ